MHHEIACIFCGGVDPANDQLLLQAAVAGVATVPWVLRSRLAQAFDRLRGKRRADAASPVACPLPDYEGEEPPISRA